VCSVPRNVVAAGFNSVLSAICYRCVRLHPFSLHTQVANYGHDTGQFRVQLAFSKLMPIALNHPLSSASRSIFLSRLDYANLKWIIIGRKYIDAFINTE